MELEELVTTFDSCLLVKADWTHQAHLRVGAWHVARFGCEGAVERLRVGIRRLNDTHGTPNSDSRGYHETITQAYCRLISLFLTTLPPAVMISEAADRLVCSSLAAPDYLLKFYPESLLKSVLARRTWIEPVYPLEIAGGVI